jgi:DNA-binding IclR family transcriptional regulator
MELSSFVSREESHLSEPVRAIERALDILLCFSQTQPALSLTEIAGQVGMPKSTVHRLLATLEAKRFITRDKRTGLYHLGFRFIEMAPLVLQDIDLERWTFPYLQHLCTECGETVDLAALDGAHVIYLQVIESPQRVKIAAAVGQRLPLHCTASGKAFLAFMPEEQVRDLLQQGLVRYTDNTKDSPASLYEDLRATRERGFAISEQEYEQDINAVAAPILDPNGWPVLAIAIVGPSFRLSKERMLALGQSIRATVDAFIHDVGPSVLSTLVSNTVQLSQRG